MRALLRLHTAIVGRIPSQRGSQTFGGLLPRQNRHFVRGNVRCAATKAAPSDSKKHKADLVLDAHFEPTTYPADCDKDDYRRYFQRGKVYILGEPKLGDVTETIRGLRPDAVVLPMPVPGYMKWMMDLSPVLAELFIVCWPKEVAVAYREAKALPNCIVRHDAVPLRFMMKMSAFLFKWPKMSAFSGKNVEELSRSEMRKLRFEAWPGLRPLSQKLELHTAYVLQRTLNERASEKYTRLQASEKDKHEPVRIVVFMPVHDPLEGIAENWQGPIEKERIDELLKEDLASGSLTNKIIVALALLYIAHTLVILPELVWEQAITTLKAEGKL